MNVRKLKQFVVVEGTTWKPSHNAYGTSFVCVVCGHNEFYKDEVPKPCKHEPEPYEIAMHEEQHTNSDQGTVRFKHKLKQEYNKYGFSTKTGIRYISNEESE